MQSSKVPVLFGRMYLGYGIVIDIYIEVLSAILLDDEKKDLLTLN